MNQGMGDGRINYIIDVIKDILIIRLAKSMRHFFTALLTATLVLVLGISCKGLAFDEPDDRPPVVRVINPQHGATIFADTIAVCLHIVDESPICQISYFIDGKKRVKVYLAVSDPDRPTDITFEMSFGAAAGQHSIEGEAEDCRGNVDRSPSISVTLVCDTITMPPYKDGFHITTATDQHSYTLADTVCITVTAVNNADTAFVQHLGEACTLLYAVLNEWDELVYDPFDCAAIPGHYELGPHETEHQYFEWDLDQPFNSGQSAIPGTYKVFGRLGLNSIIAGDTVAIQVVE